MDRNQTEKDAVTLKLDTDPDFDKAVTNGLLDNNTLSDVLLDKKT